MKETNTIKGIEVIAYKGMNSDMTCRDFQYEVGKTYKTDKAELCEYGFHACLNPRDVLNYYSQSIKSRYFKVKLFGEITQCDEFDTEVAATEMTILEEITDTFNEVINNTEWWKSENVLDLLYYQENFAKVQRTNGEYCKIDKNGIIVEIFKKTETEMEEKIKQVEDIDTLKELNKNLISENERLAKKNMKLSEKYQSTNKKNASLRTAIASIKGFENAEQLCAELNRLKQQNKSLSEANAKLIADAKVYLKTIDEQKEVISVSEKSIGTINDKLKIITLSQQSMHQALKDSGEEKSELVKKYKEALSAKSVAEARQEELEKENIQLKDEKDLQLIEENVQLKEENIHLREHMMNVYTASLIQRIKYVFTKSI